METSVLPAASPSHLLAVSCLHCPLRAGIWPQRRDMVRAPGEGKLFATKDYIEGLLPENGGHINKPGTPRNLEISSALTFGQDQTSEESKDTDTQPFLQNDEPDPDEEELGKELKQTQDVNSTPMSRLYAFEEKVGKLESDLSGEKQLWRTRYQELRIEQQALKEQQERCILPDSKKVEDPMHVSDDTDGAAESDINVEDGLRRRLGDANAGKTCTHACKNLTTDGYNSLDLPSLFSCCPSMQSFSFYYPSSTTGLKNHKCFRVFAPRSPLDLKIGSRVKVILPCGKVGTGSVCQLGQLPGKGEFQVGVDLESPYCQQRSFFRDSFSGVIVPFSKVLMVWE